MFISLITSDVNSLSAVILEHTNTLYALSYSKKLETEADSYSIQKMKEQKNDLQGFVDLFKLIETESEHEVPSFLNTHQLTKERIKNGDNALKTQPSYIKDPISEKLFNDIKGINNPSTP
jgi:predicted Zn-dependent protease